MRSIVETPPPLTEQEITGDASAAGAEGNPARDTWLTTAVKAALKSNSSIAAGSIAVDTADGVVTLFGVVSSDAARRAAEQLPDPFGACARYKMSSWSARSNAEPPADVQCVRPRTRGPPR